MAPSAMASSATAPSATASSATASSAGSASSVTPPSVAPSASVVVDVAGKVRHPGVYELPAGSRVDDAVRAAGGPRRGASTLSLNLAEVLSDGEQVLVGVPGATPVAAVPAPPAGSGDAGGTGDTASAPVDINTATLEQLDTLPGVGPVLAQNILDWRAAHGQFTAVDQLQDVSGIGPAKFAELKGLVTL